MNRPSLPRRGLERGFSLLEVIVAFAILTLAMGAGMALLSQSLRNVGAARDYNQAVMLAESRLAEVGAGAALRPGVDMGEEGGLSWRVDVVEQPVDTRHPMRSLAVSVEVSRDGVPVLTLRSLRLTGRAS